MTKLILRTSPPSPFGRKVKLTAHANGLFDRLDVQAAVPIDPDDSIRQQNPLGKIPALILEDGTVLYDSRVISEYLDTIGSGALFPREPEQRWKALALQALADGMLDAGILQVYEGRYRPPEMKHQPWLDYQQGKMDRALATLDATPLPTDVHIGTVTVALALEWFDFRFNGFWRDSYKTLAPWLETMEGKITGFDSTKFRDP